MTALNNRGADDNSGRDEVESTGAERVAGGAIAPEGQAGAAIQAPEQPVPTPEQPDTARNSATVAIWTLLSRVTGLLRVVVVGAMLGATYFANSFQATNVVPNIVFSLVAGPVLVMVVAPGLIGAIERGGVAQGKAVFARVLGWLLVVAVSVVAVLMLASPLLAWTLTRSIADPLARAEALRLTTWLLLLVLPQLPIYCMVHLGVGAQRARGRFALSAAASAVENVVTIATVVLAGFIYGSGLTLGQVPFGMVLMLGLGSSAAVSVHAALQLFGTYRAGLLAWPSLRWRDDPDARAITRRLRRSVGVAGLPGLAMYVLYALAASVPGGVFVVQMSYSVLYSLSYLSARAVGMAALPELAEAWHRADSSAFGTIWRRGLAYALIASIPLLVLLGILGGPTADVLANGQLRDAALVTPLGLCLAVVALAQLVTGLSDLGNQALYARDEDRMPRIASRVTLGVTIAVGATSLLGPPGGPRLVWLVVAILAGELVASVMVMGRIRGALRPERFVDRRMLRATVIAAVAMAPVVVATWWVQRIVDGGQLGTLGVLVVGGGLAMAVYGLVLKLTWRRPAPELSEQ
ncbi:MAG TPA: lipid II flippase MurJ [Pseudonocardia sp.]|nr:lipid II flippase MurJ [Pseudonocardia sp.]